MAMTAIDNRIRYELTLLLLQATEGGFMNQLGRPSV